MIGASGLWCPLPELNKHHTTRRVLNLNWYFYPLRHKMFPYCARFVLGAVPAVELSREFASGGGKLEVLTPPQAAVAG
jgi:hypothetical protein